MRLDFDPVAHRYSLDGVPVSRSVTGVLKRADVLNFASVPSAVLDRARVRGTIVHEALHYLNEGDLDLGAFAKDYPLYCGYLEAWQFFLTARDFSPMLCEHRVCSPAYDVAGTIDCLGVLDGRAVIVDFATGDPDDAAKDLQTAAYLALALEWRAHDQTLDQFFCNYGEAVARYAVALRADGTFSIEGYNEVGRYVKERREFLTLVEAQRIADSRRPRHEVPA
jgi:hypothetical protein